MKKFIVWKRMDTADAYIAALVQAGYTQVESSDQADFFLYDSESVGRRRDMKEKLLQRIPGFIYPHNARAALIWDGHYDPLPVSCNFVAGPAQKECMRRYGYPCRVEFCGFPYCDVSPFTPSSRNRLLFVPIRPYPNYALYRSSNDSALDFILQNQRAFKRVTICRIEGQFPQLQSYGNVDVITTYPKQSKHPIRDMIERIDSSDIVISPAATALVALARGKAVIMYAQEVGNLETDHYSLYRDIWSYPETLEGMSIDEVLATARVQSRVVAEWKRDHTGGNFDRQKFLSIIHEYI